jgi:hypothetical protein
MADEPILGFGAASGVPTAVDLVGGAAYQRMKLDLGADGASLALSPFAFMSPEVQANLTSLVGGRAAKIVTILGRRTTFASAAVFQDACQFLVGGQNTCTEPAVGTTYYAVSTSANDKAGSAGVSKVRLVSLNAAGAEQVTEITLNGTTQVSIGAGYTAFQWMESSLLGTGGLVAAGDITISSTNGVALEATTMLMIKAGGNRSMDGKYKVPTGYTAYQLDWYTAAVNQDMDTRLRATLFADDRLASPGIYHFQDTMYQPLNTSAHQPLNYLRLPAGVDIKVSTIPKATTGSPRLDANVTLLLVAD